MKLFLKITLFILTSIVSFSQQSILDRPITARLNNERLEDALKIVGEQNEFSFSYNPNEFDLNRRLTFNITNKPLRQWLDEVFRGAATYKERRNHIILQKAAAKPEAPKDIIINGYIFDQETGERIAQASVFEKRTLASAVTNPMGYYKLRLPATLPNPHIEVRKESYIGTSVAINNQQSLDIGLISARINTKPLPILIQALPMSTPVRDTFSFRVPTPVFVASADTLEITKQKKKLDLDKVERSFVDAFATAKQAVHIQNVKDTIYRPFQISLLPFIGTNHVLSGNVINTLSFNAIAGYSLGVNALEFGGLANIVRWDVHGAQFSGFANLVGRNVFGLQAAGFANAVLRNFDGMQLSGFANLTGGHHNGLQIAGFANLTGRSFNNGFQTAGFANLTLGELNGWQMAGFGNITVGNVRGWQLSGFGNMALQKLQGVQISPYFNYATVHQKGLQIALFNYADSSAALPIGLFSFVRRNGFRRFEMSTDELNYANLTFKTGVRPFYNILTIGGNFGIANKPLYTFGYGIGTAQSLGRG
ncbi:MAG: STN and carboxypeptidase regulatory-like domain-containing protein [Spirosomataceae bacterium]